MSHWSSLLIFRFTKDYWQRHVGHWQTELHLTGKSEKVDDWPNNEISIEAKENIRWYRSTRGLQTIVRHPQSQRLSKEPKKLLQTTMRGCEHETLVWKQRLQYLIWPELFKKFVATIFPRHKKRERPMVINVNGESAAVRFKWWFQRKLGKMTAKVWPKLFNLSLKEGWNLACAVPY